MIPQHRSADWAQQPDIIAAITASCLLVVLNMTKCLGIQPACSRRPASDLSSLPAYLSDRHLQPSMLLPRYYSLSSPYTLPTYLLLFLVIRLDRGASKSKFDYSVQKSDMYNVASGKGPTRQLRLKYEYRLSTIQHSPKVIVFSILIISKGYFQTMISPQCRV